MQLGVWWSLGEGVMVLSTGSLQVVALFYRKYQLLTQVSPAFFQDGSQFTKSPLTLGFLSLWVSATGNSLLFPQLT